MQTLRNWIKRLRRHAFEIEGVLVFEPLPLFVALAHLLDADTLCNAYGDALADRNGDPADLDADNPGQTSRLETAILSRTAELFSMRELLTVSWWDTSAGTRVASICVVGPPGEGLLVVHDHDAVISFSVVALGTDQALQTCAADRPESVLPRLAGTGVRLREIVARCEVIWTLADLIRITHALTGASPTVAHILRSDYLACEGSRATQQRRTTPAQAQAD